LWAVEILKSRRGDPVADNIVSAVMQLNDSGRSFTEDEISSGLQVLVQGGIGTSASAISSIMLILSQDQALQDRVRQDRSAIPRLMEECLRLEAPTPLMFRTATRDIEIAGQYIRKGEKVGLFYGAANRDPTVFDRPDEVDLDRIHCRHLTFGAGAHRCIGSNLARLQIRIAVEQLLTRLGEFSLPEGTEIPYSSLQARGPLSVPLKFRAA
jgi:cytochrome P450